MLSTLEYMFRVQYFYISKGRIALDRSHYNPSAAAMRPYAEVPWLGHYSLVRMLHM